MARNEAGGAAGVILGFVLGAVVGAAFAIMFRPAATDTGSEAFASAPEGNPFVPKRPPTTVPGGLVTRRDAPSAER